MVVASCITYLQFWVHRITQPKFMPAKLLLNTVIFMKVFYDCSPGQECPPGSGELFQLTSVDDKAQQK